MHFRGKEHYCPKEGLDKYFPGCQECPYYSICPRKDKGWKFGFCYLKLIKKPEIKNFKPNILDEYFFKFSMERLDNIYPNLNEVHLFYSGPSPIAFILGSSMNPNMHLKFIRYNFHIKDRPRYQRVFNLK